MRNNCHIGNEYFFTEMVRVTLINI